MAGGAGPAGGLKPVAPAACPLQQDQAPIGVVTDPLQGRQSSSRQGRGQGGGVAEGAGVLQQPVAHQRIARQEGATAAEGLAEGAADQAHPRQAMAETPTPWPQHPQGMGLIQQQGRPMAPAELRHAGHIGAGALH